MRVRTRTTDHGYNQISRFDAAHIAPDLRGYTQAFMSQDQMLKPPGRIPVIEPAYFPVGSTNTDLQSPKLNFRGPNKLRGRMLDQTDITLTRVNCDRFH